MREGNRDSDGLAPVTLEEGDIPILTGARNSEAAEVIILGKDRKKLYHLYTKYANGVPEKGDTVRANIIDSPCLYDLV
jgi:hypothetical protein